MNKRVAIGYGRVYHHLRSQHYTFCGFNYTGYDKMRKRDTRKLRGCKICTKAVQP